MARSLDEAFAQAAARHDEEPFVCGGADVYRQALGACDRCYLTVVERQYTGDAIFPGLGTDEWTLVGSEPHGDSEPPYRFETWDRRGTR